MADEYKPEGTLESPWFTQAKPGGGTTSGLSITADRGLTNQQVTGVADDLDGQNDDLVAALDAIAAAITAKLSE